MLDKNIEYKVKDYYNEWSVIDEFAGYSLLENTTWGDETCYLVVKNDCIVEDKKYKRKSDDKTVYMPTIMSEVFETYDGIEVCLQDEGII